MAGFSTIDFLPQRSLFGRYSPLPPLSHKTFELVDDIDASVNGFLDKRKEDATLANSRWGTVSAQKQSDAKEYEAALASKKKKKSRATSSASLPPGVSRIVRLVDSKAARFAKSPIIRDPLGQSIGLPLTPLPSEAGDQKGAAPGAQRVAKSSSKCIRSSERLALLASRLKQIRKKGKAASPNEVLAATRAACRWGPNKVPQRGKRDFRKLGLAPCGPAEVEREKEATPERENVTISEKICQPTHNHDAPQHSHRERSRSISQPRRHAREGIFHGRHVSFRVHGLDKSCDREVKRRDPSEEVDVNCNSRRDHSNADAGRERPSPRPQDPVDQRYEREDICLRSRSASDDVNHDSELQHGRSRMDQSSHRISRSDELRHSDASSSRSHSNQEAYRSRKVHCSRTVDLEESSGPDLKDESFCDDEHAARHISVLPTRRKRKVRKRRRSSIGVLEEQPLTWQRSAEQGRQALCDTQRSSGADGAMELDECASEDRSAVRRQDESYVKASSKGSVTKSNWPQLTPIQREKFQEWLIEELDKRGEVLANAVDRELAGAEAAESLGRRSEARQRIQRAEELKTKLEESGNPSTEELRNLCWIYVEHVNEERLLCPPSNVPIQAILKPNKESQVEARTLLQQEMVQLRTVEAIQNPNRDRQSNVVEHRALVGDFTRRYRARLEQNKGVVEPRRGEIAESVVVLDDESDEAEESSSDVEIQQVIPPSDYAPWS